MGRPAKQRKAYGYVRVSTEEQVREGVSLDAQRAKIAAYAEVRDLDLVEVLADEGASGKDIDRDGLQRLLELVRGREAEAVIVYKLDRLSRRTRDLLFLIEDVFVKAKTRLLSISEQIDTQSAMGKFFLTIMGALAQMERELIAERTRGALAYKREQGERLGTTPLGYRTGEDGELHEVPDELAIVLRIKKWRRRGRSYAWIARKLNDEGVPTKRNGTWYPSTVRYVARNKRYQGG